MTAPNITMPDEEMLPDLPVDVQMHRYAAQYVKDMARGPRSKRSRDLLQAAVDNLQASLREVSR